MNSTIAEILTLSKKVNRKLFKTENDLADVEVNDSYVAIRYQDASDLIKVGLMADKPFMAARFGSVEMKSIANYYSIKNNAGKYIDYIKGKIPPFWWDKSVAQQMYNNAGFFPPLPSELEKFAALMIEDAKCVDILGSWLENEKLLNVQLKGAIRVQIGDLAPYNHQDPWSEALAGKKVLVIHPFEHSIKTQFNRRALIYKDQRMLPEFELKTIKAVQSIGGNSTEYQTWFDALDSMKERMSSTNFDIAIIGCGAYGFPLAAHAKRLGKKAVHLGSATQLLFGIMGKRWEQDPNNKYVSEKYANEYWVRPSGSEIPDGANKIEDGCYW
jgi:hypothetical protein